MEEKRQNYSEQKKNMITESQLKQILERRLNKKVQSLLKSINQEEMSVGREQPRINR